MDAKRDFSRLFDRPDIVSQLSLPKLQKALREVHESPDQIETLESYLTAFPEFDAFIQRCLKASQV